MSPTEQVRQCRLQWDLQSGGPAGRPLVDLRKFTALPARLDRFVAGVGLLKLCMTQEFFEKNKGAIRSLEKRVSLKCLILPN